jgi:hypothetical protein
MIVLLELLIQLHHARREEFLPKRLNILQVKFELTI